MKCVGIQYIEAVRQLKDAGYVPKRTIYLLYVPGTCPPPVSCGLVSFGPLACPPHQVIEATNYFIRHNVPACGCLSAWLQTRRLEVELEW